MKNQYFGDKRDLFKYDLALRVCQQLGLGFTFIPMLTAPDGRTDGNQIDHEKAKAGFKNSRLSSFLSECVEKNQRDIEQLKKFVADTSVRYFLYQPQERYFTHGRRKKYFTGIGDKPLKDALVLLDPDNGLEVKHSNKKHLLFKEIEMLFRRMTGDSCLMVYQHFPREEHTSYLTKRVEELHRLLSSPIYWISDNVIVFFFIGKTKRMQGNIRKVVRQCKADYPQLLTNRGLPSESRTLSSL